MAMPFDSIRGETSCIRKVINACCSFLRAVKLEHKLYEKKRKGAAN
jgi:hypothetical protein